MFRTDFQYPSSIRCAISILLAFAVGSEIQSQEHRTLQIDGKLEKQHPVVVDVGQVKGATVFERAAAYLPTAIETSVKKCVGFDPGRSGRIKLVVTLGTGSGDIIGTHASKLDVQGRIQFWSLHSKNNFSCNYRPILRKTDKDSFYSLGIFEFHNRLNKKRCYVLCKIRGKKQATAGERFLPTGTVQWIGPVINPTSEFLQGKFEK